MSDDGYEDLAVVTAIDLSALNDNSHAAFQSRDSILFVL